MLGFMDTDLRIDFRDTEAQFAEVERRMADDGWVRPQLLQYMRSAPDFYYDEMSQIVMDHWSIGRVALVGDAAYCCSPLSGQGTSVALLGAYILAGEIKAATLHDGVDHGLAFTNYFRRFQAYTKRTQFLATDNIPGGAPISQEQFELIINSITLLNY
jgi:2-polyprenyl-6-methoxyphenol hydroxylase-like FAD-dependent oxidoreductase